MKKTTNVSQLTIQGIPTDLNEKLMSEYLDLKRRYTMSDWGPGQLKGGRFAEAVLRVFQHLLGEQVTPFGTDIPDKEKTRLLNITRDHSTIDSHVRQKVTAISRLLLDFRNNRDVAHLGGFDANGMDSLFVMTSVTWILCEFVRIFGGYKMQDAQRIIDGLSVKEYPAIMEFDGDIFITKHTLSAKDEVLVLLYKLNKLDYNFLLTKTKDSNSARFKRTLRTMIKGKFIGQKDNHYFLMPRGIDVVEKNGLLTYSH